MVEIIKGIIERRILINYRISPDTLAGILPEPFQPKLVKGYGMGGICLIRFKKMRPKGLPEFMGTSSENGTHRLCVEWRDGSELRNGIYIEQGFTNSRLHEFAGGKIFPRRLKYSSFKVKEGDGRYRVSFKSNEGDFVEVDVRETPDFAENSLFKTIDEASADFQKGRIGFSPQKDGKGFDGVQLNTTNWEVSPLAVESVKSSFFLNEEYFPNGSIEFDHALLMKNIEHNWQDVESICCS